MAEGRRTKRTPRATAKTPAEDPKTPKAETESIPAYFTDEERRVRLEIEVIINPEDDRIIRAGIPSVIKRQFEHLRVRTEWFEFTDPNYDQMAAYRQRASYYSKSADRVLVDQAMMKHHIVIWHLKDWSFKEFGRELSHDPSGALSDDCIANAVYKLHRKILDALGEAMDMEFNIT